MDWVPSRFTLLEPMNCGPPVHEAVEDLHALGLAAGAVEAHHVAGLGVRERHVLPARVTEVVGEAVTLSPRCPWAMSPAFSRQPDTMFAQSSVSGHPGVHVELARGLELVLALAEELARHVGRVRARARGGRAAGAGTGALPERSHRRRRFGRVEAVGDGDLLPGEDEVGVQLRVGALDGLERDAAPRSNLRQRVTGPTVTVLIVRAPVFPPGILARRARRLRDQETCERSGERRCVVVT